MKWNCRCDYVRILVLMNLAIWYNECKWEECIYAFGERREGFQWSRGVPSWGDHGLGFLIKNNQSLVSGSVENPLAD